MKYIVYMESLELPVLIGVYPEERLSSQIIYCDFECHLDSNSVVHSDNVVDTLDYCELAKQIAAVTMNTSFNLVESLADHIMYHIGEFYPITYARVKLGKRGVLRQPKGLECGVILERYFPGNIVEKQQ